MEDRRTASTFGDNGYNFESSLRTLRLNGQSENGNIYTARKLIARVIISVIDSEIAWVCPGEYQDEAKNWERRRKIRFENAKYLTDAEIQLDNGFTEYACVKVRNVASERLTIAAITPAATIGGG